jgi:hypothetical protein
MKEQKKTHPAKGFLKSDKKKATKEDALNLFNGYANTGLNGRAIHILTEQVVEMALANPNTFKELLGEGKDNPNEHLFDAILKYSWGSSFVEKKKDFLLKLNSTPSEYTARTSNSNMKSNIRQKIQMINQFFNIKIGEVYKYLAKDGGLDNSRYEIPSGIVGFHDFIDFFFDEKEIIKEAPQKTEKEIVKEEIK